MLWKPGRSRSPATAATRSRPTWPARAAAGPTGAGGGPIPRPSGGRAHGAMVVIHHMPGYDAGTKEMVRRFAANGYAALCPNLYFREAPGASSDDAAAFVRAKGGVAHERVRGRPPA